MNVIETINRNETELINYLWIFKRLDILSKNERSFYILMLLSPLSDAFKAKARWFTMSSVLFKYYPPKSKTRIKYAEPMSGYIDILIYLCITKSLIIEIRGKYIDKIHEDT